MSRKNIMLPTPIVTANIPRRNFLKSSGFLFAGLIAGSIVSNPLQAALAANSTGFPVQNLFHQLNSNDALIILPKDPNYDSYQFSYNMRTVLPTQIRVLCQNTNAILACLKWAKENQVPFAIRCGGHSYEGFSQSTGLVIDLRLMKNISIDVATNTIEVEAGVQLGQIYAALSEHELAIPAGSCPTVGIVGHVTGGGYGLLGRKLGLACDSLLSCEVITADGNTITASANQNADLFWALRGAGNGQLGIITKLKFQAYKIPEVQVFSMGWLLPKNKALRVAKAWQAWAPQTTNDITCIFKISKHPSGNINLRCVGQSTGSMKTLLAELKYLSQIETPTSELKASTKTFMEAVGHFSGGFEYEAVNMKAKSDYVTTPITDAGLLTLMTELEKLPAGAIAVIMDAYGGQMSNIPSTAMAFSHRKGTLCSIQYYSQWSKASDNEKRLQYIRDLYQAMRPFVSGSAYVNYCDMDLKNYGKAYWGDNYETLKSIKQKYDPKNLFKHRQGLIS